ncbi:MAG: Mut7-C ubiquitin/RNAse domain-containing protein [Desulfobacteraceae bacterium]|nr:Mut7-C ubiquitin/RNAse domain-containing protein [Desulfobacteraceae bacterium]
MHHLRIAWPEAFFLFRRPSDNGARIDFPLPRRRSIKDILESLGVPHTEVGFIWVDGEPVDFHFIPEAGHEVVVRPVSAPFDVTKPSRLRPQPLDAVRFVVDVNVGKLAALLRMLGMDTVYSPQLRDRQIASLAEKQRRVVLTKDLMLLKRSAVVYGRFVRSVLPDDQLQEVVAFFGLKEACRPFHRCIRCNDELLVVEKEAILHRLEPKTKKYYQDFKMCKTCDRIYWAGSHREAMKRRIAAINSPFCHTT